MSRWKPRTSLEALVQIDGLLADVSVQYRSAVEVLQGLQPGLSGRPAGSGEPASGGGFSATSVVERASLQESSESRRLDRLVELPWLVERSLLGLVAWPSGVVLGSNAKAHQRLVWSRWAARQLVEHRTKVVEVRVDRLHGLVCELHGIVTVATAGPSKPATSRAAELAVDNTERWCTSCLRTGVRELRSERYAGDGLCRWCGQFAGTQGFLPTLPLLDAHHSGKRITEAMILAERPRKSKKRRK